MEALKQALIKLCIKAGYLKEAEETYRIVGLSGSRPDLHSSNAWMTSMAWMVERAEEIFHWSLQNEQANEFIYELMLCIYKRLGWIEQALGIVKHTRQSKILTGLTGITLCSGFVWWMRNRDQISGYSRSSLYVWTTWIISNNADFRGRLLGSQKLRRRQWTGRCTSLKSALSAVVKVDNYTFEAVCLVL